jgi:hypothetical protein
MALTAIHVKEAKPSDKDQKLSDGEGMYLLIKNKFGNCMVELYVSPTTKLPSCEAGWLSFSCSGTFASKSDAKGMMEMAQLAFLLDKEVNIGVDDSKLHNGYCFSHYLAILQ